MINIIKAGMTGNNILEMLMRFMFVLIITQKTTGGETFFGFTHQKLSRRP